MTNALEMLGSHITGKVSGQTAMTHWELTLTVSPVM